MMSSHRITTRYEIADLEHAASALRAGAIIAFPTETVYGLGADAFNPSAIAMVFQAKGRPQDNPLIVHIADKEMLYRVASHIPERAQLLIDAYWPGPLTLLLPKSDALPSSVTAGLNTVAVRMPFEPIAVDLIRLAGVPIVAPSANLSGRPSATTWQAVVEDLDGRIDGIIVGPPTSIGLESTVIDTLRDPPLVLRHGAFDIARLQEILPGVVDASRAVSAGEESVPASPGMKHRHYQPVATVRVVHLGSEPIHSLADDSLRRGWIGIRPPSSIADYEKVVLCKNIDDYAARLFETFRSMDHAGIETIDCEAIPLDGIGTAIMDRLERASSKT